VTTLSPPLSRTDKGIAPRIAGAGFGLRVTGAAFRRELHRLGRARIRLLAGMVQPLVILFALGAGLNQAVHFGTEAGVPYRLFVAPGAAVTALTTTCLYSALSIVADRQCGFLRAMLVAPAPRFALLLGRALAVSLIGTVQVLAVLAATVPLGLRLSPATVPLTAVAGAVCAFAIAGLGSLIAAALDRQESVNAVNQLALLPLIFLSGSVYSLAAAPAALQVAGRFDPLRYAVDLLRCCFDGLPPARWLPGGTGVAVTADCLLMLAVGLAALAGAAALVGRERS
jgi:ABC-2 type transport system permease protein